MALRAITKHAVPGEIGTLVLQSRAGAQEGVRVGPVPLTGVQMMEATGRHHRLDGPERIERLARRGVQGHGRVNEESSVLKPHDAHSGAGLDACETKAPGLHPKAISDRLQHPLTPSGLSRYAGIPVNE
ncbi:MAG: hypothetical protein A2Y95_04675 [Deltaproteobacteria bacterium RBG_13_65_10]|nr:MAG: hypothetical protein A2Y95_04675 [Deltaproteobacteria bacterium RBG_13_65_10]